MFVRRQFLLGSFNVLQELEFESQTCLFLHLLVVGEGGAGDHEEINVSDINFHGVTVQTSPWNFQIQVC